MFWKNAVVMVLLFSGSYFTLLVTCKDQLERQRFTYLFAVCLTLAVLLFVPMPYFLGAAIYAAALLLLTWRGVPILASTLCLTAIVPRLLYSVAGPMGIETLINLTTAMITSFTALIAFALFPKAFVRRRWSALDWMVTTFIVTFAILYSRGTPITTVSRVVVENLAELGGFYFIASRGRTGSPMFVLRCVLMVGVAMSALAVLESVLGWLQFAPTALLRGAQNPFITSPYIFQRYGFLRSVLSYTDAIACSIYLSIMAICALAIYLAEPRNRLIWAGAIVICLLGTLATFARTGLIVIIVGLIVYLFLARRYVYAALFTGAGIAVTILLQSSENAETAGTIEYRNQILDLVPLIAKKNIVFGDNTLPYQGDMSRFIQGQGIVDLVNTYLYLFVNGGLVLIGLFIGILVLAMKQVTGLRAQRKQSESTLYRKCALAICLALYVGLTFTSPTDKNLMYLLFAAGLLRGIGTQTVQAPSRRPVRGPGQSAPAFARMAPPQRQWD